MEEERSVTSDSEEVVRLEDAVEMLVEQLVLPVLSRGKELGRENALSPEYQQIVAGQVHATVLLYNYYHRKQFPQLEFASPDQFCMSTSLTITKNNLLMYLDLAHSSVANKAIIDACDIAKALDATKNFPDMIMWPISKVAVLLLNRTKKVCLLQRGSQTKGVWSIFEKDINETALLTGSLSTGVPEQGSSKQSVALPSEAYMLQQIAYSEVELKTGMKRINLRFIQEHRVYSLSKKGTATMLYLMDYDQTIDSKIKEMPLDVLMERMTGPIFESGLCPRTTSVVEYYDLLPYKEVLLNILIRDWPLGSSPMKDVGLKEQEANINSKSKIKKITTNVSTPKKNKQVAQAVGDSGTNNSMTAKNKKDRNTNYKRKYEALKTEVSTNTELGDGRSTRKQLQASVQMDENRTENNYQSRNFPQDIIPISDVDPLINDHSMKSKKEKVTEKSGVQMDDNITHDNSESRNLPQDIIPISDVDPVINDHALKSQKEKVTEKSAVLIDENRTEDNSESRNLRQDIILTPVNTVNKNDALEGQKEKVTEKSGAITGNMNAQMYVTLKLLRKMRDDTRREHFVLDDRSAEYEMDIQTILAEMEMTPKVTSILKKYQNNSKMMDVANRITTGEGCQTMNIKRKKLIEAIILRNKCQELDDLCRESNWILPRYRVLSSVTEDMYQANVHLMGPDFNLTADGDMKVTPHQARDSAASNMLSQLEQKAREGLPQDIILTPVNTVVNNDALEGQKEKVTEKSDGITCNMNVQMYATLKLLRNMRDDTRREHFVLDDRSAEYEMDIQTILAEMEMTPKVTSILKKYENRSTMMDVANRITSGEGCQTMNIKRKKLIEAIILRNKCQELDDLCRESNWILPRYRVLPSVTEDMYQANVHLTGPDFNLSADGDMKVTPHEARDSAASNMLSQLQQKAREG